MILDFCLARLNVSQRPKVAELFLKCKAGSTGEYNEQIISSFCYPLGPETQVPKEYMAPEEYSFTLTQSDGRRAQGFCRRFLPPLRTSKPGSKLRYPLVLCVVCETSWYAFFFKVLQLLEQLLKASELLFDYDRKELPESSYAGKFLTDLGKKLALNPDPGSVIRLALPEALKFTLSVSPPKRAVYGGGGESLEFTDNYIDLQVPPDCGLGRANCGVSLARLLWHVPVPCLLTLIASLLLERRVVLVCQSADTLTAAVNAAAALLYPFEWHHIYLPLLPLCFKDYLTAPMPFLVGLPAQMLPMLKHIPMSEVTIVDLDLGTCDPAPGSDMDDSALLPWRDHLERALRCVKENLKSPTEYESNALVAGIMHEYFLKLFGNYRKFVHEEPETETATSGHIGQHSKHKEQEALRGFGYFFDYASFVASRRCNPTAAQFLEQLRHSQLMEVFIQEHFKLAKDMYDTDDTFEQKVTQYMARKASKLVSKPASESRAANLGKMPEKLRFARGGSNDDLHTKSVPIPTQLRRTATQPRIDDPQHLAAALPTVGSLTGIDPAVFFQDINDDDASEDSSASGQGLPRRLSTASLPALGQDDDELSVSGRRSSFSGENGKPAEDSKILSTFAARLKHKIGGFVEDLKSDIISKEHSYLRGGEPARELARDSSRRDRSMHDSPKGELARSSVSSSVTGETAMVVELTEAKQEPRPESKGDLKPDSKPETRAEHQTLRVIAATMDLLSFGSSREPSQVPSRQPSTADPFIDLNYEASVISSQPAGGTELPPESLGIEKGKQLITGAYSGITSGLSSAMRSISKKVTNSLDNITSSIDSIGSAGPPKPYNVDQVKPAKALSGLQTKTTESLGADLLGANVLLSSKLGFAPSSQKAQPGQPMNSMRQQGNKVVTTVPTPGVNTRDPPAAQPVHITMSAPPLKSAPAHGPAIKPVQQSSATWDPFADLLKPGAIETGPLTQKVQLAPTSLNHNTTWQLQQQPGADPFDFLAALPKQEQHKHSGGSQPAPSSRQ